MSLLFCIEGILVVLCAVIGCRWWVGVEVGMGLNGIRGGKVSL